MPFGVTPEGFVPESLNEVKTDLEGAMRGAFGQSINVTPPSRFGQLIGILSERISLLWAIGEALYAAGDPDQATGAALDAISAITGTIRLGATKSAVELTNTGTPGTVLLAGRVASVVVTGIRFVTLADSTLLAVTAWQATHAYLVGDRRTNAGNIYICTVDGISAGAGGPAGNGTDIVDNTVRWRFVGGGTAAADVAAEAQDTGPKVAVSGTLTQIQTPVAGWGGTMNLLDADVGRDVETDEALRLRREGELRAQGEAAVEAVRAHVLRVAGVTAVTVFSNDTDYTDADGLLPHSIEVLVRGGADADIRAAIFASKAAGIGAHGTVAGTVVDAQGFVHQIDFSRPTPEDIYVDVTLIYDANLYPLDGDDEVKAAIVAFGDAQSTGKDAVASSIGAQAFKVPGVLDVTLTKIGLAPFPGGSATIPITLRQLALYDSSRIVVHSAPGIP